MLTNCGTLFHDFDAIPTWRSHLSLLLLVDCSLFALSFRTPAFVFNSLQPLFAKHPGWGYPGRYDVETFRPSDAFFVRPLFSQPYESLFLQTLSFHIHTNP